MERLRAFVARCEQGTVLDVGCGAAGHVGRFVSDLGARVTGVDLSARSAALAQRLNATLRVVAADMRALPIATGASVGIVAFYSLIYTADPSPALAELRRVLRPGGALLIAVHAGEGAQSSIPRRDSTSAPRRSSRIRQASAEACRPTG